jgi:hypothetical protein
MTKYLKNVILRFDFKLARSQKHVFIGQILEVLQKTSPITAPSTIYTTIITKENKGSFKYNT